MALHDLLNNFSGGEISPLLDARVDLQKYKTSCRRLENMRVLPYGGTTFRAGMLYIAGTKTHAKQSRLISFIYSTTIAYAIEMGDGYMRFYRDGEQIESSPGVPYEVVSVYLEAELFEVQFKQINDVMYLAHPSHGVQKLTRVTETSWTLAEVVFDSPALLDENTTAVTMTVNNTSGSGRTMTASSATFFAAHVGSYWEIKHLRAAGKVEFDIYTGTPGTTTSTSLAVKGDWSLVTTERWYGELQLQRSYDGGTVWETFRTFTARADRNVNASGTQETAALFRMQFICAGDPYGATPWSGTAPTNFVRARAALEVADTYIAGLVLVTAYTSSTVVTVTVINTLEATTATKYWSEGAWSTYQGFPRAVGLFEQRLFFAGTTRKPNTTWGSVTGDFENFQYGDTDDAAVAYQLAAAQQNPINWIETLERLWAGTSGGEHYISSGNENEPLTPSNVIVRDPSAYGSTSMQSIKVDRAILFMQRQGTRLRQLKEDQDPDKSTDLTVLAEHLLTGGFTQLAYARLPDPYLYAVMGNGQMAVMAYLPEQNVNGWSRYITDGLFESVCALPGTLSDVVYVIVKRTIGGATKRYVEVFTAESTVGFSWMHMDSALTFDGPLTTVTGLNHLEGEEVAVVAGATGYVVSDPTGGVGVLTVSGGSITLPAAASFIRVGLPYSGKIEPMTLDAVLSNGTSQGRKKRISELCVRFKDTLGGSYGTGYFRDVETGVQMSVIPFRSTSDNMDEAPPLHSEDVVLPWEGGNEFDDDLQLSQVQPLPMTVLGVFAKLEVFGQ